MLRIRILSNPYFTMDPPFWGGEQQKQRAENLVPRRGKHKIFFCAITIIFLLISLLRIRIRMDPEIFPGSGTRKIQSWIRIRNKSFRIHNTDLNNQLLSIGITKGRGPLLPGCVPY